MYTREHLVLSLVGGGGLVPLVETPLGPPGTVAFAAVVGTLVDLDHFLIARVRTGSWAALRRAIADPRLALIEQDELFEPGAVGQRVRLASHLVIGVLLVAGLVAVSPALAVVAAVVLGLHVLADAAWDAMLNRADVSDLPGDGTDEA